MQKVRLIAFYKIVQYTNVKRFFWDSVYLVKYDMSYCTIPEYFKKTIFISCTLNQSLKRCVNISMTIFDIQNLKKKPVIKVC